MDNLDKILLKYLPDTGLCARGKAKQADRRNQLKAAILQWHAFCNGGTIYGPNIAIVGDDGRPEVIIDEITMGYIEAKDKAKKRIALRGEEVKQIWERIERHRPIPPPDRQLLDS